MSVTVSVKGGDRWKKALAPYRTGDKRPGTQVGALEGATYNEGERSGELVAPLLAMHEFGTSNIPARAPLRSTFDKKKGDWLKLAVAYLKANPGNIRGMFVALGEAAAKDIQFSFEEGLTPELKAATIRRKEKMGYGAHASKPVILTGQTQQAIASEYVDDLGAQS